MYITKLPGIDGDSYRKHQVIRQMFPGDQRVLFQKNDEGILVLSDLSSVTEGLDSKELDTSSYKNGGQYAFSLRLNPVKRDIKTRKRVALDPDQVKGWVTKQLSSVGIDSNFQYIREGVQRSDRQGKAISLVSILVFGVLTIKDDLLFYKALRGGIGHGKGLGFGFLNVFS
jgi:CRISPR-associated protein Cas6/Cse3/CasE subtype I-E